MQDIKKLINEPERPSQVLSNGIDTSLYNILDLTENYTHIIQ